MIGIKRQTEYYNSKVKQIDEAMKPIRIINKIIQMLQFTLRVESLSLRVINCFGFPKPYKRPEFTQGGYANNSVKNAEYIFAETITKEDLSYMKNTIHNYHTNISDKIWIKAFKIYNNDKSNKLLNMGCRPCYAKVYMYFNFLIN